jgi:hypothetical protein
MARYELDSVTLAQLEAVLEWALMVAEMQANETSRDEVNSIVLSLAQTFDIDVRVAEETVEEDGSVVVRWATEEEVAEAEQGDAADPIFH